MFRFKKVEAENFLSFERLTMDLENQGLILINGRNRTNDSFDGNGSGKSSLMNSIMWGMFGKTPNSLSADDVVNNKVGKNTVVTLHVEVDEVPYRIERYRKHTKNKNTVKVFREDKEITGKSVKDTDNLIVELFGVDYTTFTNTIFFGQGNVVTFANATDKERKEILERVTGIEVYRKAQDIAKEKVKEQNLSLKEKERELDKAVSDLERLDELEQAREDSYSHTAKMIENANVELEKLIRVLKDTDYDYLRHCIKKSIAELGPPPEIDRDTKPEGVDELSELIAQYRENAQQLKTAHNQIMGEVIKADQEIAHHQGILYSLDTADTCPTCGAPIDIQHVQLEQARLTEIINESGRRKDEWAAKLNEVDAVCFQYESVLADKQRELKDIVESHQRDQYESLNSYREALAELQNELRVAEASEEQQEREIDRIEKQLEDLHNIPKPTKDTAKRNQLEELIDDVKSQLDTIKVATTRYEDAVNIFSNSGIRSVVLDLVTPYLNERANHYSNLLTGGDIEINFSTQTTNKDGSLADKFDVEIMNRHGGLDYKANSGGEKKRIDLAISFALQDLLLSKSNMRTNIALYDECFEALDMIGCENVIEVLREKQEQVGTIFVITHNETLKNLFDNVVTVEKVEGTSHIVKEGTVS